jgi:hypothetical protein
VPAGFDFAFYNAAPRDQQIDVVRPGTSLILENLNPRHARLETRLPTVRPKAFLVPEDLDRAVDIALRCDTVWIDADRALMTMSYRGYLSVPTPDDDALGMIVVAAEAKGREVGVRQIARLLNMGASSTTTDGDTFAETNRLIAPSRTGMPVAPQPILIQSEETAPPMSWEELSSSDLFESTSTTFSGIEDPKTLERIDVRRLGDEPRTRPASLRAPLGVGDRARIAVAIERGDAAAVMLDYGMAPADLLRLQRAWEAECAADPAFAAKFAAEVAAARRG